MQDDNKTLIAKDWMQKLANGINPLDGTMIPDGDIVNNVHISRCLFYVAGCRAVGISAEMKMGTNGPYWAIAYNANAQRFILNHIYAIVEA